MSDSTMLSAAAAICFVLGILTGITISESMREHAVASVECEKP